MNDQDSKVEETSKLFKNLSKTSKADIIKETERMQEELDQLRLSVEEILTKKVDKKEFIDMKAKIITSLQEKVELTEVIIKNLKT